MKFKYIILGKGLAKQSNGFSGKGNWDLYKCFVDNGKRYGEFYLNLNTKTGEGELLCKDKDYGVYLTTEFSKEMMGELDSPAFLRKLS